MASLFMNHNGNLLIESPGYVHVMCAKLVACFWATCVLSSMCDTVSNSKLSKCLL